MYLTSEEVIRGPGGLLRELILEMRLDVSLALVIMESN
jgi:hypothetical protein